MTTDLASSGKIVLDPALPFGLVKTTSKTVTYTKDVYSSIVVKEITTPPSTNFSAIVLPYQAKEVTTGVSWGATFRVRFKAGRGTTYYLYNKAYGGTLAGIVFGARKLGSSNNFDQTEVDLILKNITNGTSVTVTPGNSDSLFFNAGDIGEIEYPIPLFSDAKGEVRFNLEYESDVSDIICFYALDVEMYHDGSLERGSPVTLVLEVYDTDGTTVLGTFEIDGVVSPYDFSRHDVYDAYKAGYMKAIEQPIGTWALKSGATGVYARLQLDDVKVGGVSKGISDIPNLFDTLEISFMHKDEYDNIVAMPVCELITGGVLKQSAIPFQSSDEELPDGKGGNCALVAYIKPLKVSEILGKRIEIATSLWVTM